MKKVNQEAACRLENSVFTPTGHKTVTKTKKEVTTETVTP